MVTSILNFYIPTALITALYVRIFIAIKQRSKDICKFGAYTASGMKPSGPKSRGSIVSQLERHGAFWQDFILLQLFPVLSDWKFKRSICVTFNLKLNFYFFVNNFQMSILFILMCTLVNLKTLEKNLSKYVHILFRLRKKSCQNASK